MGPPTEIALKAPDQRKLATHPTQFTSNPKGHANLKAAKKLIKRSRTVDWAERDPLTGEKVPGSRQRNRCCWDQSI